jgi:hypothetical protein
MTHHKSLKLFSNKSADREILQLLAEYSGMLAHKIMNEGNCIK